MMPARAINVSIGAIRELNKLYFISQLLRQTHTRTYPFSYHHRLPVGALNTRSLAVHGNLFYSVVYIRAYTAHI